MSDAVEETKEEVQEAVEAAEEAVEKVEEIAAKTDEPKVEAAAEKAEAAVEKVEEAIEKHEAAEAKEEKAEVEVPKKFKEVVETIEKLSVLELSELVKVLESKFGVSAAPMAVAGGGGGGGGEAAGGGEEKSAFNVVLTATGDKKIEVIKAVREITGKGLAESKAIVDAAPGNVIENAPKAAADEAKAKLEAAGATVELK